MRLARLYIQTVVECLHVSEEAVRRACKIHGMQVYGQVIGCDARRLPLDFYRTVHEEDTALKAMHQRRHEKTQPLNSHSPSPPSGHCPEARP